MVGLASYGSRRYHRAVYQLAGTIVERGTLPPGDAGTHKTLAIMRRLVHRGARDPVVREAAIEILKRSGARTHDARAELQALFAFVRDSVRFTRDTYGVETLQSPRYTLRVRAGDCDDKATLLSALAIAVGIPADLRLKAVGSDARNPSRFSHVYVTARVGQQTIPLDPTHDTNELGDEPPRITRSLEVRL